MKPTKLNTLIAKAEMGRLLTVSEQSRLADKLVIYQNMALRLEQCVHAWTKESKP